MDPRLELIAKVTEAEFRGKSLNGKSLVDTIEDLSLEQVTTTETHQNFTVWAVVMHNMYFKWKLLTYIEPETDLDFPYDHKSFPALPGAADEAEWEKTKALNLEIHDRYMEALGRFDGGRLQEVIPDWDETFGDMIAWTATHDSYHVAQIRNMGVPGL